MITVKNIVKKSDTLYKKLQNAFLPVESVVAFNQDCDEYLVLVKKEQVITEGQIIASGKKTGCNLHAPVSGKIIDIFTDTMPNGKQSLCARIALHGKFSHTGKVNKQLSWDFLSADQLTRYISEKGVVNTFNDPIPLTMQIEEAKQLEQKNLIVRLYDDDPTCCIDAFLAQTYFMNIIEGAYITAKALQAEAVFFMFSPQKLGKEPEKNLTATNYSVPFHFIPVNTDYYPCGGKREIIDMLHKLKHRALSLKDIAIDSVTALAVYEAVCLNKPLMERYIQISGDAILHPKILKAKIGTPIGSLFLECGGFICQPAKIVINGLIKGVAVSNFHTPITKYVKSITVTKKFLFPNQHIFSCIHCGQCHQICPANLHPDKLYDLFSNNNVFHSEFALSAQLCYSCKLCNSVCPSRLPLFQAIHHLQQQQEEFKNEN